VYLASALKLLEDLANHASCSLRTLLKIIGPY